MLIARLQQIIYADLFFQTHGFKRKKMMTDRRPDALTADEYAGNIFAMSEAKFQPEIAPDLWTKIERDKWLLSEKLSRHVDFRTACIDFLENLEHAGRLK